MNARSRFPLGLLSAAVAGLLAVAVAGASNSGSFTDPSSDAGHGRGEAPDITAVDVSTDDAGTITFRLDVTNRPDLALDDEVGVTLDLDQNPDTGSVFYGSEVAFAFEGEEFGSIVFFRANQAGKFSHEPSPPSLDGTYADGVATFTVKASDLGLAPNTGFNVMAIGHSYAADAVDYTDTAPDIRTFNYQPVAGTAALVLGPDTRAPLDEAFRTNGKRGTTVELDYEAADGRGVTADTIRVYRGKRVLKTVRYRLEDTNPWFYYYASWRVPRSVHGRLRWCVSSTDAAGNKSNVSCAPLVIR